MCMRSISDVCVGDRRVRLDVYFLVYGLPGVVCRKDLDTAANLTE